MWDVGGSERSGWDVLLWMKATCLAGHAGPRALCFTSRDIRSRCNGYKVSDSGKNMFIRPWEN